MDFDPETRNAEIAGRYHKRYARQDRAFRLLDRALAVLRPRKAMAIERPPSRILIVNAGHLGDVIISTGLLPVLHDAFPGVEIGFLTGTHSRMIVDGHPLVARTHVIDHWYLSRKAVPLGNRMAAHFLKFPASARELRASGYDVAIEVRGWFPNLIPLLWRSGIPIRIGYNRVGFGPLLTHSFNYDYGSRHELEYQLALLRPLGVSQTSLAKAWPTLASPSRSARQEAEVLLPSVSRYRVLHPMSSTPTRDWQPENWQALARDLLLSGITPVLTGAGERERAFADTVCAAVPGSINVANRLSWGGLLALIERAEAVYAVETSVGHAASALRTPVISIYGGMADPSHWAPLGASVATKLVPCHPCLNKHGCADRQCLLGITVEDVQSAARAALRGSARTSRANAHIKETGPLAE